MYSGKMLTFQIDANFGFPGAVLAMLIVDLPNLNGDNSARTVVLGPKITPTWGGGSVRGLRLRGGGYVDSSWNSVGVAREAKLSDRSKTIRLADKYGELLASREKNRSCEVHGTIAGTSCSSQLAPSDFSAIPLVYQVL
jgi:alpha-L-fucosidase 2